jgi:hypothetical protein
MPGQCRDDNSQSPTESTKLLGYDSRILIQFQKPHL